MEPNRFRLDNTFDRVRNRFRNRNAGSKRGLRFAKCIIRCCCHLENERSAVSISEFWKRGWRRRWGGGGGGERRSIGVSNTRPEPMPRHATHYIYSTPSLYAYSSYYYYYYYTSSSSYYYYSSSHAWIPRMLGKSWNGRSRKRSIIDVTTNNDDVHMFHPSIFFFGFYDI